MENRSHKDRSENPAIALRSHFEKFTQLTDHEFDQAFGYFVKEEFPKDVELIQSGKPVPKTYWVDRGLLYSTFLDEAGKEHVLQFAIERCWITDQEAFYNQKSATLTIRTLEDSTLFSLSFSDREKLCATIPALNHFFRRKANDSFVKQQRRLLTYLTSDAQKRFDLLMLELPGLDQRVPKKLLAGYLGVSRETLSRFKK